MCKSQHNLTFGAEFTHSCCSCSVSAAHMFVGCFRIPHASTRENQGPSHDDLTIMVMPTKGIIGESSQKRMEDFTKQNLTETER